MTSPIRAAGRPRARRSASRAGTSGGLLLAAPAPAAPALLADLRVRGLDAALIGEVTPGEPGHIEVLTSGSE